jgi:hypothetical protein
MLATICQPGKVPGPLQQVAMGIESFRQKNEKKLRVGKGQ